MKSDFAIHISQESGYRVKNCSWESRNFTLERWRETVKGKSYLRYHFFAMSNEDYNYYIEMMNDPDPDLARFAARFFEIRKLFISVPRKKQIAICEQQFDLKILKILVK